MRLTVLHQTAKGLPQVINTKDGKEPYTLRNPVLRTLESIKWCLWHGNIFRALQETESITMDLDVASRDIGRYGPKASEGRRGIPDLH